MIRPTRMSGGVAALALVLATIAIIIESAAAVLAAGSLSIFLLWRAGRFERDLASVAASLTVSRDVDRTILRQGVEAHVRVRVDLTPPPGMEVLVRDVPPVVATGTAPLCEPGRIATYTIRLMAPGKTSFGGVVIEAADTFFTANLVCRRFNAPQIRVFPNGVAGDGQGVGAGVGDAEVDRRSPLAGQGIRGFRPYREGDDPGLIDWKVTARHDALYVRELTGLEGGTPLIAVDLPARVGDLETFARFSMAVSGAVEGAINSREGCSLLVVTGPEVIRFLPGTMDIREALDALGRLTPVEPRAPLYRSPGPAILTARARIPPRGAGEGETVYLTRLGGTLSAFAGESPAPFAAAVREALGRVADLREVRIFSLLQPGDKSHLIQLIHEAKVWGMRVTLRAPPGAPDLPGADAVEAI